MEESKPEEYFIPANITDNSSVLGTADKRKCIEMAVVAGVGFLISFGVFSFLGIVKDLIIFAPFLCLVAFTYVGYKGEALFEHLIAFFVYKRKIRTMKYKLPRREIVYEPKIRKRKKKKDEEEEREEISLL